MTADQPRPTAARDALLVELLAAVPGSCDWGGCDYNALLARFDPDKGWLPVCQWHAGKRGLLPSAPKYPVILPDIDKLVRAILDALTGIVWRDDAQVVAIEAYKRYSDDLVTVVEVSVAR